MDEEIVQEKDDIDLDSLSDAIASSSVKRRRSVLSTLRQQLAESKVKPQDCKIFIDLLFKTYPRYADRESRRSVQGCLQALADNPLYTEYIVILLEVFKPDLLKPGLAPSSLFVLLEWGELLLQYCGRKFEIWERFGPSLVSFEAQALDSCLSSEARLSLKQSALILTRRSFRRLFKNDEIGARAVVDIVSRLTTQSQPLGQRSAVLLGVIAGVCARLSTRRSTLEGVKDHYYSFYIREVLSSRSIVPEHIGAALNDLFSNFTTFQDFKTQILPALEKSLLRAPEVVLNDLVSPLVVSLPSELDLAEILADSLLKPLLSNAKSQNPLIRNGAISAFEKLAVHSHDEKYLAQCADEILNPLATSKLTTADHRALHAQLLSLLPYLPLRSFSICEKLTLAISKEPNEVALGSEVIALSNHFLPSLFKNSEEILKRESPIISAYVKGLSDKKPGVRRLWVIRVGDMIWRSHPIENSRGIHEFCEAVLPKLLEVFEELLLSSLPAGQTVLAVVVYVVVALTEPISRTLNSGRASSLLLKAKVIDKALTMKPKPSLLLNHRIYTKISTTEDYVWMIRALGAISSHVANAGSGTAVNDAWAQAVLFLVASADVSPEIRKQVLAMLSNSYLADPAGISNAIICGLWSWVRQIENMEKDTAATAARTGTTRLHLAVQAICYPCHQQNSVDPRIDTAVLEDQLIEMLVLCHPEVLSDVNWIELCLRVGQDPGALVKLHTLRCLEKVEAYLTFNENQIIPTSFELAAYKTAADLAFVAPEQVVPLLLERIEADSPVEDIRLCGPLQVAIAHTPEGVTFVDIIDKKGQNHLADKSSRDYDTIKWEEEVRSQLARKKGQEKKLSSDEKIRMNAQLVKEAAIRKQVKKLAFRLRRAIGFINALVTGPPVEPATWLGKSLSSLLNIITVGAGRIVDDAADLAYISCAKFVSTRVGNLRSFIGIATLRALGFSQLPPQLEQEPLGELVTRLLYRLRATSEQRSFDGVSLIYILPFVSIVLSHGGVGQTTNEEADEQVFLALEFLSFSTDVFSDASLPRKDMLSLLVTCMQKYPQHYKILKDCLLDICRSLSSNISSSENLVLLKSSILPQTSVRETVLQCIRNELDLTYLDSSEEIWLASHDDVHKIAEIGRAIWEENALEVEPEDASNFLPYLSSPDKQLRRAASRAIVECIGEDSAIFSDVLNKLEEWYRELSKPRVPQRDEFGMLKKTDLADPWEARSGIALTFNLLAPAFSPSRLVSHVRFLITDGALGDRNTVVRDEMIESATTFISRHGASKLEELMSIFEAALEESDASSQKSDLINEAIVILYGSLARHLQDGDERVPKVVRRLLLTLDTPSETVQYAVAGCLPFLIKTSRVNSHEYVQAVLDQLLSSKTYAARRGGAYGLAGIVCGKGISALREFRIMSALKTAVENKKNQNQRQGALFAYELLSLLMGRTFEPYIIQIVPQLLSSFGDSTSDVREACLDTSKTCFASLSSYGVKIILPTLLEGLDEQQWRSKKGACDLLGVMAYLDPQQLAISLPDIIPPLTNVLNDSHKEVRASANRSLQRFGEVISNPEVKGIVSILLKALSDPTKYTDEALDALIKVSFIHYLDAPSLALIVRILERGLGDRSGTKLKSAKIIGSLAHLTERKDVVSHLPILVAGLRTAAIDPVPATRATASKALGSLVEKLGEDALPDLIPSLMATLRSDTGAGDRLGSAQALSEVLAGLGTGRLEESLPTILQNVASPRPAVREGFMSLFIYLPACFGNSFVVYLSKIIPSILAGLADEVESIRETSLRAGRLLVKNFATKAIDLLLPELDRGLADESHRIRLSSVDLVGHLLFNLTGISGNTEQDEEEEGAAEAGRSLLEVLGEERRNRILSSLYICRCDTSGLVRNAAINVWKALVATPRTLKELVPTLSHLLIRRLASSSEEQRIIAGNALGELIRKAGDGVLASLLPTLEEGLQKATDKDSKQGICIALREIVSSASAEVLEDYEKTLISVVRVALIDSDDDVRDAAAEAFDSLQKMFGKKAVDQVLPYLLNLLRMESEAKTALSALLTLLTDNTRSNIILPNLIPTLLVSPITAFNAKALASLSEVAGPAMTRRLPIILNTLVDSLVACKDDGLRSELEDSLNAILTSVDEYDGLNAAMSTMLALVKDNDHRKRATANMAMGRFFDNGDVDYSRYNQDLIRAFLIAFDDSDIEVVKAAWFALSGLTRNLKKEEMEALVISTHQVLQHIGVPNVNLPGFDLPKGINAILPIFLQGLMNGTAEQRTTAALAISDIIDRASADALKPFVTHITGPLIRVVSERSVEVKGAILLTLNKLLEKIPLFLKPFLPQLQRTFAKALADPSSELLRSRAARALGTLITLTPRIDPLIAELATGSKTADSGVRNAMLRALYEVVRKAGGNMSEVSITTIVGLISSEIGDADEATNITSARLFGALVKYLPPNHVSNAMIKQQVLLAQPSSSSVLNLNSVLLEAPEILINEFPLETPAIICHGVRSKNTFVSDNSVLAAGKYLLIDEYSLQTEANTHIFEALVEVMAPGCSVDSRRLALVVVRTVSRKRYEIVKPHLDIIAPAVFSSVRDSVIPVKLAAEAAFLAIFSVVEAEREIFDRYISRQGPDMNPITKRNLQDYFKRIALRLGVQARERREAEGGQGGLGLSNDELEDEREIWSVGKVDLDEDVFAKD